MNIYVNLPAFTDVIIYLILFWAIYRGYMRGAIIHSVALLVLLASVTISIKLSYLIYEYIQDRARVTLYNLPVAIFFVLFVISVVGSHLVANKVIGNIGKTPTGTLNKVLGIFVNLVKYLFMLSIGLIMIFKLDANFSIIDEKEKEKTTLFYPVLNIAPSIFNALRFQEIHPVPTGKPDKVKRETGNERNQAEEF